MPRTTFTQALFDRICERMAAGESVRAICETAGMPNRKTIGDWVAKNEKLAAQYVAAQEARAEHYFDEIIEIADSKHDPQQTRVQIDARKWVLGRMNPKKYGDKFTQEMTGAEGGPIVHKIEYVIVDPEG